MYLKIIVFLLVSGIINVFCDDDQEQDNKDISLSYFQYPKDSSCGLDFGGAMVQPVAIPYTFTDGLFWNENTEALLFVDRFNATIDKYLYKRGKTGKIYIEELENTEIAAIYPIEGRNNKFAILANNSVYIFTKNSTSVQKVFNITDDSRIISISCTTTSGHIFVGTKPSNYAEEFPNVKKGNAKFYLVDLIKQKVAVIEDGHTFASGVAVDYIRKYCFYADLIENKVWRREMFSDNKAELVFDMKNYDFLSGRVSDIILDVEGFLWISFFEAYYIIKFDVNNNRIVRIIPITVPIVNSLAWGGLKYDVLFAGSSAKYISDKGANIAAGSIIAITGTRSKGWYQHGVEVPEEWLD